MAIFAAPKPVIFGVRLLAVGHVGTRRRRLRRSRAEAPVRLQQGSVGPVAPTVGVRLAGQAKRRRRACLAGARTAAARAQAQSSSTRCPVEMRPSSGASCAHHVRSRWSTIPSGRAQCNLGTSGGRFFRRGIASFQLQDSCLPAYCISISLSAEADDGHGRYILHQR